MGVLLLIENNVKDYIKSGLNIHEEFLDELINEINNYDSSEQLLRNGGIPITILDRLAHGFAEKDIKTIDPSKLKIKWKEDLLGVKYEIKNSGLSPRQWALKVDLREPIEVSYWGDKRHKVGFYIEDGHHRYMAAKILKKHLNVDLEIDVNPIKKILPSVGYDEFHRLIFNIFKKSE